MGCCFATATSGTPSRESQERQEAALPKGNAGNPDSEAKSATNNDFGLDFLEQEQQRLTTLLRAAATVVDADPRFATTTSETPSRENQEPREAASGDFSSAT